MFVTQQCLFPFSRRNRSLFSILLSSFYCTLLYFLLTITTLYYRQVSPFHRPRRPLGRVEIQLYFIFDLGTRRGEGSASRPGRSLPRERPGTHCTGGWVGLRAGLNRCGKYRLHRDSIPGPSSPQAVAIPATLPDTPYVIGTDHLSNHSLQAHHKIPLILWNPRIHHKKDILGSTLSQMNPVHILNAYFFGPLLSFESRRDAMRYVSCPSRVALNFLYRIHLCVY